MQYKCFFAFLVINVWAAVTAESYCCRFDTSLSFAEWTNADNSTDSWKWSGYIKPLTGDIPYFYANSDYIWVENLGNDTNTKTAIFKPYWEDTIIDEDDVISIGIYRHILYDDGSYRPKLTFVSDYGTHSEDILWSFSQDDWSKENVTCGLNASQCCLTYPCTGYFEIIGTTMEYGELIAIDFLSINLESICGR